VPSASRSSNFVPVTAQLCNLSPNGPTLSWSCELICSEERLCTCTREKPAHGVPFICCSTAGRSIPASPNEFVGKLVPRRPVSRWFAIGAVFMRPGTATG
jgi:hypothetical protein